MDRRNSIHYSLAKRGGVDTNNFNSFASLKDQIPKQSVNQNLRQEGEELRNSLLTRNNSTEFTSGTSTYIRGGCCENMRELFSYRAPTQIQLRAFLFSPSERYSTFLAKEDVKQKKIEEEKKTQKGESRRGTSDFQNEKKPSKVISKGDEPKSEQSKSLQLETEY